MTQIGILLILAEVEGPGPWGTRGHDWFSDGSLQGRAGHAGAAELRATAKLSIQLLVQYCTGTLQIIFIQIMHGMRRQYSRVPAPSLWFSLHHVYAVKSEYK